MNNCISDRERGLLGEKFVSLYFEEMGCKVELSKNKYDDKKDMTIDGLSTEIKTQTVYRFCPLGKGRRGPAFTIDVENSFGKKYHNQLDKCKSVERLIFLGRPSKNKFGDLVSPMRLYEAPVAEKRVFTKPFKNRIDGRVVVGVPIDQLELIDEFEDHDIVKHFMDNFVNR